MEYLSDVAYTFIRSAPALLVWLIGIILALVMVRRGGGRVDKLFLAGCILMLLGQIGRPFTREAAVYLRGPDTTVLDMGRISTLLSLPVTLVTLAGIICLVWAFYRKFWTTGREAA